MGQGHGLMESTRKWDKNAKVITGLLGGLGVEPFETVFGLVVRPGEPEEKQQAKQHATSNQQAQAAPKLRKLSSLEPRVLLALQAAFLLA